MSYYVVTATNKKTGKREVVSLRGYTSKKEAEKFITSRITLQGWKNLPPGVTKQQAMNMYRYKNHRVKKVL